MVAMVAFGLPSRRLKAFRTARLRGSPTQTDRKVASAVSVRFLFQGLFDVGLPKHKALVGFESWPDLTWKQLILRDRDLHIVNIPKDTKLHTAQRQIIQFNGSFHADYGSRCVSSSQFDLALLPFYDVNYTIRPLETTWTEWQRWRQGSTNVDPFKSTTSLDQRVAEVKSQFFLKVPGAIAGLPENLTQEAAPMKGSGQLGELWGDLPKRMELKAFANIDLDLWHRENWMLRQPRVTARLTLRRPQNAKGYSAKNVVDAEIGLRILNELMSARLANLTDLGTTWKIETGSSQSFTVLLSSFAVNAKEHFAQVLTELVQEDEKAAAAERRLVRLRRELKMELEDQSEAILSVAVRQRNVLLMPQTFARHELLSALVEGAAGTTQEALDVLKARRLGNLSMTGLVMGSCSLQLAEELQDKMLTQLGVGGGKVDLIDANRSERVDRVVRYSHPLELRGRNPRNDSSHAMLMTIMVGPSSIKQRVLLGLISEVLNEVAFKVLRTELQLGYVAGGSVSAISNILTVSCFAGAP
eukprot:s266_g38.t3